MCSCPQPLINRVLKYPDLSHQYVCLDTDLPDFSCLRPDDHTPLYRDPPNADAKSNASLNVINPKGLVKANGDERKDFDPLTPLEEEVREKIEHIAIEDDRADSPVFDERAAELPAPRVR